MNIAKDSFYKAVSYIKRLGIDRLVSYLETETDYFTAPASTNFHGNYEGGLLDHSMNVLQLGLHNLNFLVKKNPDLEYLRESVVICALFHDLCKTNFYEKGKKWTKDDAGKWKEYDSWLINDKLPLGHGEKSLYIVSKYLELTNAEAMAIRWHMGHTEISIHIPNSPQSYAFNQAVDNPLVYIIHCADMLATTMEEKKDLKNS